jgi:hypothetical protein
MNGVFTQSVAQNDSTPLLMYRPVKTAFHANIISFVNSRALTRASIRRIESMI